VSNLDSYTVNPDTECWEWTGYADSNGYGRVYDPSRPRGSRTQWVHRVSYETHNGPIPAGYQIDHTCQNTICMNPRHLDAVSATDHAARTMQRLGKDERHQAAALLRASGLKYSDIAVALQYAGRVGAHEAVKAAIDKGLVDPNAVPKPVRLSDAEREDIRDLYALGVPQTELASWYGVDSSAVSRICNHLETRSARHERGMAA
jgi:hypothetical protein